MPLDPERLYAYPIPEVRQTLTRKDVMLYALSVGLGQDPMDDWQRRFVFEKDLVALPTMAVVLGYPGFWLGDPATGVDAAKVLHGEQSITLHRPLPVEGTVVGRTSITGLIDRGAGKGAILYTARELTDGEGNALATLESTTLLRGDGGFGGPTGPVKQPHPTPERPHDAALALATRPEQALLYRLNGDLNPLHADPEVAARAGFPRPILHGLCTLGVVGHALLRLACGGAPERLRQLALRFSAPVFPGETIETRLWDEGGGRFAFTARVAERDVTVITHGLCEVAL
ncbi:MaoC family dehydratase N-terminal domain-containing protein [Elioraea tepida]|jgi:acyl dehydratase|uniref:MaoC family dehydratase N-terminal domain-containing protein n=1 Tax=Elioraea tepida TaxID=2843330 RepID=A0A975YI82_9PROT|nr:MaoC/PaaZ C-terminal domain-containing protein [Elioraea tepida]QXM23395.1 MaoC family dehydratase N-terminal domain-containing protein [Elioraea tepida]